jgi:hypothetical protein
MYTLLIDQLLYHLHHLHVEEQPKINKFSGVNMILFSNLHHKY